MISVMQHNSKGQREFSGIIIFGGLFCFIAVCLLYRALTLRSASHDGAEHVVFYLACALPALLFFIKWMRLGAIKNKILLTFLLWKIPLSFFLVYLLRTRYNGGDFILYYDVPSELIAKNLTFNLPILGHSTYFVTYIFYCLFQIFPPSLYGLAVFFALISLISYLFIYLIFKKYVNSPNLLFVFLFLIPSIAMQSSYIGKDGLILLCFCLIFFLLERIYVPDKMSDKIKYYIWMVPLLLITLELRIYQTLFILSAFYLTYVFYSNNVKRFFLLLMAFGAASIFLKSLLSAIFPFMTIKSLSTFSLTETLGIQYYGGSHMLVPFPFPLQVLQIFRPFPWEAENSLALLASIELFALLGIFIVMVIKNFKYIGLRIKNQKIYGFLLFYVIINIILFSFSPNVGDLLRRRIYIIPFLSVLLLK